MENNALPKEEMNNSFKNLSDILFESIKSVKDGTMKPDQAKAIQELSQTVINGAKVQLEFIKHLDKPTPELDKLLNKAKESQNKPYEFSK